MGLFYPYVSQNGLNPYELRNDACGYAAGGYMFDPHKSTFPNWTCLYRRKYVDILEVYETDLSCHFFESC